MKMLLLHICRRCEIFFNDKAQQIRLASTRTFVVTKENNQLLKNLGFQQRDYKYILPKRRGCREWHLQKVVDKLLSFGFTPEDIKKQPKILCLHPHLIDHRFKLMEESGIEKRKITIEQIRKFPRLNTSIIRDLKNSSLLNREVDVVHSILSFSDVPRELYPSRTSDYDCIGKAQTTALQTYFSWKLGLSMEEVQRKYEIYEYLKQKSIRLVMEGYEILINRYEMPVNKIKQNIYLFESHPENFLEILEQMPKFGDFTIQRIAVTNPKILRRPVYKMLKIIDILKKFNVPEESYAWYSNVLTFSPDTVKERAGTLYADPAFHPFFCSPGILFIISRYHTSTSRSKLLKELNWRCLSIPLLTHMEQSFERRISLGHDESRSSEVMYYLKRHLGYGVKEIRKQLRLHPFYFLIPITSITETVQFLLKKGISKSDVFQALPIVLYPKDKVLRWLEQVHSQPEVQGLLDMEDGLPPSIVLQLVLYYIERPYHFSGHGIWSEQDGGNLPSPQ